MVHSRDRCPSRGRVAVVTGVGAPNVRRRFTLRRATVMAARTGARHTGVIESDGSPGRRSVAVVTGVGALDVRRRFTLRRATVVATVAGADH